MLNAEQEVEAPSVFINQPTKIQKSKKKINSNPFDLWQDVIEGKMTLDPKEQCFTYTTKELHGTTTNNTIFVIFIQVAFGSEVHSISIPIGIPSRAYQIGDFVVELMEYHQTKMRELKLPREDVWEWFKKVIRNSWISFLGMKESDLNLIAVKQGFERHNGGSYELFASPRDISKGKLDYRCCRIVEKRHNDIQKFAKENAPKLSEIESRGLFYLNFSLFRMFTLFLARWVHFTDTETSIELLGSSTLFSELQLVRIDESRRGTITRKKPNPITQTIEYCELCTDEGVWHILSDPKHAKLLQSDVL